MEEHIPGYHIPEITGNKFAAFVYFCSIQRNNPRVHGSESEGANQKPQEKEFATATTVKLI